MLSSASQKVDIQRGLNALQASPVDLGINARRNHYSVWNRPKDFTIKDFTVFISDIDGTISKITNKPYGRVVEDKAYDALLRFETANPNQVILASARDEPQTRICFDKDLSLFTRIVSNGKQLFLPNGEKYEYSLGKREKQFEHYMKQRWATFCKANPHLLTEEKDAEIGYHTLPNKGVSLTSLESKTLQRSIIAAKNEFVGIQDEAKRRGVAYKIFKSHEITHRAFAHAIINKADALTGWFQKYLHVLPKGEDWSNVVFCGDGLLSNDQQIAALVRKRGGFVIMVTNDEYDSSKKVPPEGFCAEPDIALHTPEALGQFLKLHVDRYFNQKLSQPNLRKNKIGRGISLAIV